MKLVNIDLADFMTVVDKCEGNVWLVTKDGDKLNMKSKLCQMIGIVKYIKSGEIEAENVICDKQEDSSRIFRFLLYKDI